MASPSGTGGTATCERCGGEVSGSQFCSVGNCPHAEPHVTEAAPARPEKVGDRVLCPDGEPADPVVSPADTIRHRLRVWAEAVIDGEKSDVDRGHDGRARISQRVAVEAAEDVLALLAVGERDRQQIARLTARIEVVKGNVYLWQIGELDATAALKAIVSDVAVRAGEEDAGDG